MYLNNSLPGPLSEGSVHGNTFNVEQVDTDSNTDIAILTLQWLFV